MSSKVTGSFGKQRRFFTGCIRKMDVLNISMDDNEGDTSQEEFTDEYDISSDSSGPTPTKKRKAVVHCPELFDFGGYVVQRPDVNPADLILSAISAKEPQKQPFKFMMVDCVSTFSPVTHPCFPPVNKCPNPLVMRLFGVTEHGYSVSCNVHGFLSYFYALPTNEFTEEDKDTFMDILNNAVKKKILNDISCVEFHDTLSVTSPVTSIEIVKLEEADNVYHLFSSTLNSKNSGITSSRILLKIVCSLPKYVWTASKVLKNGLISYPYTNGPCEYDLFENNINNNIRFLTDKNLPGCGWLELPACKYFLRSDTNDSELRKESYCQIELDVHCDDIKVACADVDEPIPPLRILSFDIEVLNDPEKPVMPSNGNCPVIQIGTTVAVYGEPEPLMKIIFTLNDCDSIDGAKVIPFIPRPVKDDDISQEARKAKQEAELKNQEALMLKAWRDLVIQVDPDVITGYNINLFDLPYLVDRANLLQHTDADYSIYLGRMKNLKTIVREIQNPSKCSGNLHFDRHFVNIHGRVNFDMFRLLFRHDVSRQGLSLKQVAKRHLQNEIKGDVDHTEIGVLQAGSSTDRKRLAVYCLQDAYLAYKLLLISVPNRPNYGDFVEYYFRKSCSCGTLLRYTVNKSAYYNQYFKEIRKQKNPHTVFFQPLTPSPKKRYEKKQNQVVTSKKNLYSDLIAAEHNHVASDEICTSSAAHVATGESAAAEAKQVASEEGASAEVNCHVANAASGESAAAEVKKVASGESVAAVAMKVASGESSAAEANYHVSSDEGAAAEVKHLASGESAVAEAMDIPSGEIAAAEAMDIPSGEITAAEAMDMASGESAAAEINYRGASGESAAAGAKKVASDESPVAEANYHAASDEVVAAKAKHLTSGESVVVQAMDVASGESVAAEVKEVASGEEAAAEAKKVASDESSAAEANNYHAATDESAAAEVMDVVSDKSAAAEVMDVVSDESAAA